MLLDVKSHVSEIAQSMKFVSGMSEWCGILQCVKLQLGRPVGLQHGLFN